jgi:hypothetical protein
VTETEAKLTLSRDEAVRFVKEIADHGGHKFFIYPNAAFAIDGERTVAGVAKKHSGWVVTHPVGIYNMWLKTQYRKCDCGQMFLPKAKNSKTCEVCLDKRRDTPQSEARKNERFRRLNANKSLSFDGRFSGPEVSGVPLAKDITITGE